MEKFNVSTLIVVLLVFLGYFSLSGQVNYTAHDFISPYNGGFHYGVNMGGYGTSSNVSPDNGNLLPWTDDQLAEIAIGNPAAGIPGTGVTSIRLALPNNFVENPLFGWDIRIAEFQRYAELGLKDHTVFLNAPTDSNRDWTEYCPGIPSKLFRDLHTPIWDNGANGTPYNDNNPYAKYVYEVVSRYGKWVKYWEVWNEPDFATTFNNTSDPGTPGSWWTEDPSPCDMGGAFGIQAPISHYVRMLKITYEIVKTLYPESYVALGGIGYPSFLDAVLRNTDNPNNGDVSSEYPLTGGAYFDVLSWHYYPHLDEAFKEWNNDIGAFEYTRNSDLAYDEFLTRSLEFNAVLEGRGYNGGTFPKKLTINTETNIPRVPSGNFAGGDRIQSNYNIKSMLAAQKAGLDHLHIYHIGEKLDANNAFSPQDQFDMMGLYKNLLTQNKNTAEHTDAGIAIKTMSDALKGYWYDEGKTNQLQLPFNVRGGAFSNPAGETTYMLWARTFRDGSEDASATYTFPSTLPWTSNGSATLNKKEWNYFRTNIETSVSFKNVALTGNPVFLSLNNTVSPCDGLTVVVSSEGPTCFGYTNGTISVNAFNGIEPYLFKWEDGTESPLRNNLVQGTYFVTVTDGNGCNVNQAIQLNAPNPMNATIQITNETVSGLNDGRLTAFASGGTPGYNYYWSNNVTGQTNQGLSAGMYSLTVNDSQGCPVIKEARIESDDIGCGTYRLIPVKTDLTCFNSNNGTISANPQGGTGYSTFLWNTGAITEYISGLAAGTYRVTATDELGCTAISTTEITSPTQLTLFIAANQPSANGIDDGSASAFVNNGTAPYSYIWSNQETTSSVSNLTPGVYSVTVVDANGCQSIAQTEIISPEPDCLDFAVSIGANDYSDPRCPGTNTGYITANPVSGVAPFEFKWSTGAQVQTIGNLPAGTYFITITDGTGCVAISAQTLVGTAPIVITPTVQNATGLNMPNGEVALQVNGGTSPYRAKWSNGLDGLNVTGLVPGAYNVTITDANDCNKTRQVIVDSEAEDCSDFSDVLWQSQNIECSNENDGAIILLPQGGQAPFTYQWSNGASSQSISNLFAGNYTVTVVDNNGCPHIRTIAIVQPSPLIGSINATLSGNCGDIVDLVAFGSGGTPPYSYTWSNGAVNQSQFSIPSGNYVVTITDANFCTFSQEFTFQEDNSFPGISQQVGDISCNNEVDGYINISVLSGQAPYTYQWSNGSTTQDIGTLEAGVYDVTVYDANGCASEHSFIVSEPENILFDFTVLNPSSEDEKGSIKVDVYGGVSPYTYLWDFGANTQVINNVDPGTYSITVTDANGCTHSESVELSTSTATTHQNAERNNAIKLYPNPSKDFFFIELPKHEIKLQHVTLLDIHGKVIRQNDYTQQDKLIKIDVQDIVSGAYLVHMQFEDGYSLAKRIILLNN